MFSHQQVWAVIDALAEKAATSPSGLARRAGLDPTAFNKSKRFSADGRPRWPSTESLSKVLAAAGSSMDELAMLMEEGRGRSSPAQTVPLIGFAQAGAGGYFDDAGFPAGEGWEMVELPGAGAAEGAYALQVQGDSMLPLYRDGDVLIVEPAATVKVGDRVVVRTVGGEVTAKILARRGLESLDLRSLNPEHPDRTIAVRDVEWIGRIAWASQ